MNVRIEIRTVNATDGVFANLLDKSLKMANKAVQKGEPLSVSVITNDSLVSATIEVRRS